MSFTAERSAVWYDVQLDTDMPGVETVTYRAEGKADRTVVVKRVEDGSDRNEIELHERQRQTFRVRCGRDPSHAKGGIDAPEVGDVLIRSDGAQYGYTGEQEGITPHAWTLVFRRAVPDVAGRTS